MAGSTCPRRPYRCELCDRDFGSWVEVHRHAESYEHRQRERSCEGIEESGGDEADFDSEEPGLLGRWRLFRDR